MCNDLMPGSITPHGKRFRVRLPRAHGRKTLGFYDTFEEAEEMLKGFLLRHSEGRGRTLRSWGEAWFKRRASDGIHRDVDNERSRWRMHVARAAFIDMPLRRIDRHAVVRWIDLLQRTTAVEAVTSPKTKKTTRRPTTRRISTETIRRALAVLRACLSDAADLGHVKFNAALGVRVKRRPTSEEAWTFLTLEEIDRVMALKLRPEQRAIFSVAIYTGLRGGELWGLRWQDVQLEGARPQLVVRFSYDEPTKPGRVRRVPLLPQAIEALKAWRDRNPRIGKTLVFPAKGGRCHADGFDCGWPRIARLANLDRRCRLHDLRHTCGSQLIMGGWMAPLRLEQIRDWLGHSSITVTERYAHLAPDALHGTVAKAFNRDTNGTQALTHG
jgi:integrase